MKTAAWIMGIIGMALIIDAVLALGFEEKYVSLVSDYAPVEYVNYVYDVAHSSIEVQLFVRLGEMFLGYVLIMLSRSGE